MGAQTKKVRPIVVEWDDPACDVEVYCFGAGPALQRWTTRGYYAGETANLLYVASEIRHIPGDGTVFRGVTVIHKALVHRRSYT